jgi:hypothetical protein
MRQAKDTDFFIELEGVGSFRYGRRTFGDNIKIRSKIAEIKQGKEIDDLDFDVYSAISAAHSVLCVSAPKEWEDIEAVILDSFTEPKIFELFHQVKEKEDSFRGRNAKESEGRSEAALP